MAQRSEPQNEIDAYRLKKQREYRRAYEKTPKRRAYLEAYRAAHIEAIRASKRRYMTRYRQRLKNQRECEG